MLYRIWVIVLCIAFVFATSGNSSGLIFKNMAIAYHMDLIPESPIVPFAEEINEEVKEPKSNRVEIINIPPQEINRLVSHGILERLFKLSPHIREIPVPPPEL